MKLTRAEVKTLTSTFHEMGGQFSWHDGAGMGHVTFPHHRSKDQMMGLVGRLEKSLSRELAGKLSVYARPGMLDLSTGSIPLFILRGLGYNPESR